MYQGYEFHKQLSIQALIGGNRGAAEIQTLFQVSKCLFNKVFVSVFSK
jgi:hypothetical protein